MPIETGCKGQDLPITTGVKEGPLCDIGHIELPRRIVRWRRLAITHEAIVQQRGLLYVIHDDRHHLADTALCCPAPDPVDIPEDHMRIERRRNEDRVDNRQIQRPGGEHGFRRCGCMIALAQAHHLIAVVRSSRRTTALEYWRVRIRQGQYQYGCADKFSHGSGVPSRYDHLKPA